MIVTYDANGGTCCPQSHHARLFRHLAMMAVLLAGLLTHRSAHSARADQPNAVHPGAAAQASEQHADRTSTTKAELLLAEGFEAGLKGWGELWTRQPNAGKAQLDESTAHSGRHSVRIEHRAKQDWSFHRQETRPVAAGEIYRLRAWVRIKGPGKATLGVILRQTGGRVIDWSFGGVSAGARPEWQALESRFLIPPKAASMQVRLIGSGEATVWLDDLELRREGSIEQLRRPGLPETLEASNELVQVRLITAQARLQVTDRRTKRRWQQAPAAGVMVLDARPVERGMQLKLLDLRQMSEIRATVALEPRKPEVTLELGGQGPLRHVLRFPPAFVTSPGEMLIMPVNEGISYPVDDQTLQPMWYHLYGGHGLCMAWYGQTDGRQGVMTIVETPDDAAVRVPRVDGRLRLAPEWQPQKGQFGPVRRLRYVLFDDGGYVAMCRRYREHARQVGLLKTLAEKRRENPNVDLLIGAVNVWCWERDAVGICRELQSAGIRRILWSHRSDPDTLRKLNAMGVLTSRYDIYQDVMNPANFPKLRGVHPDWTTEAWPDDLMIGADGQWVRGWRVQGKDGQWYACGVLCDRRAVDYARRRIPPELKTHPYRCRFIDTTTASPWRECYHPDHPMTRSESRHWKMELLRFVSEECGLVTGSETGHEAAVPCVHYFEGMLSLGPYRIPDAGRRMGVIWEEVPPRVAKFQTGHYYRLPLWELVYHDCVVAQWYWGDYNNKLPKLWDRRDLFNALYGTPPMFMFNRRQWEERRDRFVQSYRTATPVARATGYVPMISHRWLTDDHAVQQTQFANGVRVTVNFGEEPFTMSDGFVLEPLGLRTEGMRAEP